MSSAKGEVMTGLSHFSTDDTPLRERSTHWNAVIADAYFPLMLHFRNPLDFSGQLSRMNLGQVGLSRLTSDPVNYERRRRHICESVEEEYLITLPMATAVEFRQLGRDVRCEPGGFLIERGDEPYRFMYEQPNDLFVLKVSKAHLCERIRQPDRFCAQVFDATSGTAGLFRSMAAQAQAKLSGSDASARSVIGRHLLELLSLTLDGAQDANGASNSSVRSAHLARIDRYIRANLGDQDLSPDTIAEACGISKRYLHDLFKDVNGTVSQQIRDQRLQAACDMLRSAPRLPLAEVAYRCGFSDQAQFSRLFKSKYARTPSEYRNEARPA